MNYFKTLRIPDMIQHAPLMLIIFISDVASIINDIASRYWKICKYSTKAVMVKLTRQHDIV